MNLGTFQKQPAELIDYDVDYSEWLTTGDNVQSADVSVLPSGLVIESTFINDPRIKIWISGGTDKVNYKITVTMTTADGRIKQDEFKINVKDR